MATSNFRVRVLILAAYMVAAILPALTMGEGRLQSRVDHEQMMSMVGHMADMAATNGPDELTQQLLCQQHCLFGTAALPALNGGAEAVARAKDVDVGIDLLAVSLAIPPPGHPPKIAAI